MSRHRTSTSTSRRGRVWLTGAVAGAAVGGLLAAVTVLVTPAQAAGIPVACDDNVTLEWDDVTYDLQGTCGVVVVKADDVVVNLPATQKLVVRGHGNLIDGKTIDRLVVTGHHQEVRASSVRAARVSSPNTLVDVEGLVEELTLTRRGAEVRARQVTDVAVRGHGHEVRARRGYDARVPGDHNQLRYRRLDTLRVGGDHNTVVVTRRSTSVGDSGRANAVRVHRRR